MTTTVKITVSQEVEVRPNDNEQDLVIVAAGGSAQFEIEDGKALKIWPTAGRQPVEFPESLPGDGDA